MNCGGGEWRGVHRADVSLRCRPRTHQVGQPSRHRQDSPDWWTALVSPSVHAEEEWQSGFCCVSGCFVCPVQVCAVRVCCASVLCECAVSVLCECPVRVCCPSVLCECAVSVLCQCAVSVLCSRLGCSRAHAILVLPTVPLKQVLSNGQESVCHYTNRHCTPPAVC